MSKEKTSSSEENKCPGWIYGMIKVDVDKNTGEDIGQLVELFPSQLKDGSYAYRAYSLPSIQSIDDLRNALKDVEARGIDTWFYDNGKFEWNPKYSGWDWEPNEDADAGSLFEDETIEEIEAKIASGEYVEW